MSYLFDLVKTFDDAERQQFRQLDLIGKEELLRDAYANADRQTKFNEAQLPSKLNLSQSHFDKINSVLLSKTLKQLYGTDYMKCFSALVKRGLTQLMYHQLKITERNISTQKKTKERIDFYQSGFEALCSVFHPHYDAEKAALYGKKYLRVLGKRATFADEVYVAMRVHQSTMVAQAVAGNEETYRATAQAVLNKWRAKIETTTSKQAWFHFHFTEAGFVKFYGSDAAPFLTAMEKCKSLLAYLEKDQKQDYSFRVYCELSFGYIEAENYRAAEQNFETAFALPYINPLRQSYQSGNYLYVCLINKNYRQAQFIFKNYLNHFLEKGINRSVQFDVLVNALMLHLHTKQFNEAFEHLQQMRTYKRNEITPMGQVLIRVCETLYFYCQHEYKIAAVTAKRNMRFLNRPENRNAQFEYHLQLLSCLYLFSKQKEKANLPSKEMLLQKAQLRGSMFNIFNQLI